MSITAPELKLPVIVEDVSIDELKEIERRETSDALYSFLWTNGAGVNVVYLDIEAPGHERIMVQIPTDRVMDAREHPAVYAASAGYPVNDLFGSRE